MAEIPLSKGKVALVDDADFSWLNQWNWFAWGDRYAKRRQTIAPKKKILITMHRLILGLAPGDPEVDHKNGNGFDNRRSNLRVATRSQNMANQKTHTGVHWHKISGRWRARVKVNGRYVFSRNFRSKDEAIAARIDAARKHFKEFAPV